MEPVVLVVPVWLICLLLAVCLASAAIWLCFQPVRQQKTTWTKTSPEKKARQKSPQTKEKLEEVFLTEGGASM